MAGYDPKLVPLLRHVEAHPVNMDGGMGFVLHDPTGLAASAITVSQAALFVLSKFDGHHTLEDVQKAFRRQFGEPVTDATLARIVEGLTEARLLAGEEFDRFYAALVQAYHASPARVMRGAEILGHNPRDTIQKMLDSDPCIEPVTGRTVGLVAPHLDFPRGEPCYSAAYAALTNRPAPQRVVILGTNHFGRSAAAVVTGKGFQTPLGTTAADVAFIEQLEARCGDVRAEEFDHQREHSVELQLVICQHIWGADAFRVVPVLCPDPCGPTGTAPYDGRGVDLRQFAGAMRECIEEDADETLVIAGADLSHVGVQFGDDRVVDDEFAAQIRRSDECVLEKLAGNDSDALLEEVARENNPTRICSAGCIFTAMCVLPQARVKVLRYHQAIDPTGQVGVTCAAAVFVV